MSPTGATTIPPPPPLPPPPRDPLKPSRMAITVATSPAVGEFKHSHQSHPKVKVSIAPFQPCHMFFYGSLMDPEVLQAILNLAGPPPIMQTAVLSEFKVKMWGIYPALIPSIPGKVIGRVWKVVSEDHFNRLVAYETDAYSCMPSDATLNNGEVLKDCRTFCWAGDPDSKELEDGSFDLERYQKYFKSSVTRKRLLGT